ncbi:histidine kinase [Hymenobacter roseosalivarius DSM 11622]|uniref:histidine kinase n=1 Tax=Hymenobacter roseosalivarius DSM 11622 TaxID=645990 RepID=A0A1W1UQ45_9BACT|nr:ATP-binding protein [Hymenobacter roseosalivarius]SMB83119.1 histidine kinase [Hymenobacter roseosalivarius DSM 11622]
MASLTSADLAAVPVFADLPPETINWLLAHGERREYAAEETVFNAGDQAEYMIAVLRGEMQFFALRNGNREPIFRVETGQISGVLPYSRLRVISGYGIATAPLVIYALHRDLFPELERTSPELTQRLVALMSDRARDEARGQERDDKLRALGKLSAGLAHELNNPAAAIARAAQALNDLAKAKPTQLLDLLQHCPNPDALKVLTLLATETTQSEKPMSALECADYEDDLADWLEEQGVADGYRLAAGLLEAGVTKDIVAPVAADLPKAALPSALAWLEGQLTTQRLIRDVQEAGNRISTLVASVKTYSHMDRATDRTPLDVHSGLESTLTMLGHQLRDKKIRLTRDFAPQLPLVRGQVSSLNQVWTNLLDNAIDAVQAGGEITVRTHLQSGFVRVAIIDNGSGIAPEVLTHIFEPFFTTKQAGSGSGLGLDIAQRIVRSHNGRLEVESVPGHTEFSVWLPALT